MAQVFSEPSWRRTAGTWPGPRRRYWRGWIACAASRWTSRLGGARDLSLLRWKVPRTARRRDSARCLHGRTRPEFRRCEGAWPVRLPGPLGAHVQRDGVQSSSNCQRQSCIHAVQPASSKNGAASLRGGANWKLLAAGQRPRGMHLKHGGVSPCHVVPALLPNRGLRDLGAWRVCSLGSRKTTRGCAIVGEWSQEARWAGA